MGSNLSLIHIQMCIRDRQNIHLDKKFIIIWIICVGLYVQLFVFTLRDYDWTLICRDRFWPKLLPYSDGLIFIVRWIDCTDSWIYYIKRSSPAKILIIINSQMTHTILSVMSVSYTHLDVYKRQHQRLIFAKVKLLEFVGLT